MAQIEAAGPALYFAHADHLGTPDKLTDATRAIVWDAALTPWGEVETQGGSVQVNIRLPGQYHDQETGLSYNWHRDYDPTTGRYMQSDPIGLEGGINRYAYVGGNPVGRIDPSGLKCMTADDFTTCSFPGGGPTFRVPAQSGFPDRLTAWHPLHHAYDVARPLGRAALQCVLDKLRNNPTPGSPNPATPEGTSNNAVVPGIADTNWVTSYTTTDLKTGGQVIVNMSGPRSAFGPGYVARVVTNGVAHTYGEGTHLLQSRLVPSIVRTMANELLWGRQMERLIDECTCGK